MEVKRVAAVYRHREMESTRDTDSKVNKSKSEDLEFINTEKKKQKKKKKSKNKEKGQRTKQNVKKDKRSVKPSRRSAFEDACPEMNGAELQVKKKKKKKKKALSKRQNPHGDAARRPPVAETTSVPESQAGDVRARNKVQAKKRVMFDLSPEVLEVKKAPPAEYRSPASLLAVTASSKAQDGDKCFPQTRPDEASQGTAEDVNSQDLFITQKTFLAQSSDLSSGDEGVDQGVAATGRDRPGVSPRPTAETATQTENFFTSPALSAFLRFHRGTPASAAPRPLDLALPNRQRAQRGGDPSEDGDALLRLRSDFAQAIQTRLNESFFFKLKGEAESPKAQSPLMKFAESHDRKQKK
ncbi:uncharacterized protein LOC114767205 [Denticeps clupeoides]|uniref:uncharacterized protein LOC114767205 n=1 Tax=Denticeps clupeoides TaxID=299321 RepID=UPI0010A4E18B|nr:uncharacterized protein LOC114767205 [Denticeps clupeoides]